ncbi:MAG: MATE family efflux transporter [Bacteroidetes bacterium]|nr:MAG: MATE family efflux transporter [Bacteroidota bacterium]
MKNPILRLAIPNILSNITVPLVGIVDLALMGHMDSEIHLNAIAIGGTIFSFIYMSFGFLRMGTTGFIAQAHGSKDGEKLVHIFSRALLVAFSIATVLLVLQLPIGMLSVYLLNAGDEINSLALEYFHIRIFAAPATLALYAIMGWFIGRQDTKTPLFIALLININNVAFNVLFIYAFDMKSSGVAWGTVIAQYIGFTVGMFLIFKRNKELWKKWIWVKVIEGKELKKFFLVNRDIFIRTLLLIITITFFTASSARMGKEILAVNTILFQFFLFFTYFIDGFANAAEALVGKHIGENNRYGIKILITKIFTWGFIISLPFAFSYFIFGKQLMLILTNLQNIIDAAGPYIIWIGIMPILSFAAFIWDGVYVGAMAAKAMRNSMLISSLLVFFPLYFILHPILGNHGLWIAFNAFLFSRGLILHLLAKRYIY